MIVNTKEVTLSLLDASIEDLQFALTTGIITCVELVTSYLDRIATYDCRGPSLNSIPILNPHVYDEAAASDQRRACGNILGPLDGIPFTVKDSYKVKGLTVASGSPAFQDLISNDDAFTVKTLKKAGAVLLGKTNMCPMAAGGMQRGVYGRAESPYSTEYLPAAFASGSSNGSGVSTAASFAAFGMGEETVSSGRSPASNNALVAYTPSRGAISIRGNWPLYPTCDVVVPHTRSVDDMLTVLDATTIRDECTLGDFWRDQEFVPCPTPWKTKPESFRDLASGSSLAGCKIAVPTMYIGGTSTDKTAPVYTSPEVISLYQQAKLDLEALGAKVVEVPQFPVIRNYELANSSSMELPENYRLPTDWNTIERSLLIARAWEQFLYENDDFNIQSLAQVDGQQIYPPHPADDPQLRYTEPLNRIHYDKMQSLIASSIELQDYKTSSPRNTLMSTPNLRAALEALETIRKVFFEDWLSENSFDMAVFPACGDVGKADADIDYASAEHAWRDGVKYSNGNRALRHLGIPSVTVPMGNMKQSSMPVGLTIIGKAGDDLNLLRWAHTYEQATRRRTQPKLTPELGFGRDVFGVDSKLQINHSSRRARPDLKIEKCTATPGSPRSNPSKNMLRINITGFVTCAKPESRADTKSDSSAEDLHLQIQIDSEIVPSSKITIQQCHGTMCGRPVYDFRCCVSMPAPPERSCRDRVASRRKIARDSTMVIVTAWESNGWRSGVLKLL